KRGIKRDRPKFARDHVVAVRLEAGGERPFHLLVGEDVDVGIDHEHVLDIGKRSERCSDGVAGLARYALAHGDAHVVHAAGRGRGPSPGAGCGTGVGGARRNGPRGRGGGGAGGGGRLGGPPPMVSVWNSASRRRVMGVTWKIGLVLTPP